MHIRKKYVQNEIQFSKRLQDNKKSFSAVYFYPVEWPKENTDKYIQGKGIGR